MVILLATACGARSALDDAATTSSDATALDASPWGEASPSEEAAPDAATAPSCEAVVSVCDAGLAATCDGCATPAVLATCQSLPGALAIDDVSVVWINEGVVDIPQHQKEPATFKDGAVVRCDASGCGNAPSPIVVGIANVWMRSFAVASGSSHYGAGNDLFTADNSACTNAPASAEAFGYSYAADDVSLYFTTWNDNRVYACSGPCTSTTLLWTAPTVNVFTMGIAVDATDAYWTTSHGEVYRCAKSGCAGSPTLVTHTLAGMDAITLDDANVYTTTGGHLLACPKTGCTTPMVLTAIHPPTTNLVTDGANLYWTALTGAMEGGVFRCAVTGCSAPDLIARVVQPGGIALDATRVYWSDTASGTVSSLPK